MPRGPRHILPGVIQAVVTRCVQGRFLLRPDGTINRLIIGVLAMAQMRYAEVKLFCVAVPSNHMHILLWAPTADLIAGFMEYVNGNIAREVARKHNWQGMRFWSAPYSSTNVMDDAAALRQLKYHLAQCCKDGLVDDPRDWPGVHAAAPLCAGQMVMEGEWVDRTGLYHARRAGRHASEAKFTHKVELTLSPLPQLQHLSGEGLADVCTRLVEEICQEARAQFGRFLGVKRVLRQSPHGRPNASKKTKRPVCHASDVKTWFAYLLARNLFRAHYRAASGGRNAAPNPTLFPRNCFLPGGTYVPA